MIKVGLQVYVVEFGIVIVFFDISLCGDGVVDDEVYDLGQGVGFYVNVIEVFWVGYFQMEMYIVIELWDFVLEVFLVLVYYGIIGYLMGGYGVLILVMKYFGYYRLLLVFVLIFNLM